MKDFQLKEQRGSHKISAVSHGIVEGRLSIVVPTYNEAENIVGVLDSIYAACSSQGVRDFEIIVVDDNSKDGTSKKVEHYCLRSANTKLLCRVRERGLSSAIIRGWQHATGEYLAVIDADGQHPAKLLADLYHAINDKQGGTVHLAIGTRYGHGGSIEGWGIGRRIISIGSKIVGFLVFPEVMIRISDSMSGCFVVRRSVVTGIKWKPQGFKILLEILCVLPKLHIKQVGYTFGARHSGKSKASIGQGVAYLLQLGRLRFVRLARLVRMKMKRDARRLKKM